MSDRGDASTRCPSAQPGMPDLVVLGVVSGEPERPEVAYLRDIVPATAELLQMAAPLAPMEVFRLAGRCAQDRCVHFNDSKCSLATRIVEMLPEVTASLPPCTIRQTCRWYGQEGRAACHRCPQIVTLDVETGDLRQRVAGATMSPQDRPDGHC